MKTIGIIILAVFFATNIFAQDVQVNDVSTPRNNTVNSWITEESSTTTRKTWDNYYKNTRPNAAQIKTYDGYSSTRRFNCHSYAWYMSQKALELTNPRWIGYYSNNTDEHIYWDDGSYIEVASETYPGMVRWASGDHSAITTSTSGKWKSKWNEFPLFLHNWDDTEYGTSDLKYYTSFRVDGPRYVCNGSNATFTTPDYVNCTFSWTYDTSLLNEVSGQGTKNFLVTPKSSSVSGLGGVYLTLTIGAPVNKTYSNSKYIGVNMPHPEDLSYSIYTSGGTPVSYMCANTHYHIYLTNNSGCSLSNYTWSVPSAWSTNYTWGDMISVYTNSTPGGMVEVYATTCCGVYTKVKIGYLGSGYCGGYYAMSLSPNPSSGETTLTIEPTSEDVIFDENTEWEVEIFDQRQMLKEKRLKLKGRDQRIQTSGWKSGIYIVRVKYKDENLQAKLVVK
ncbi:MAG: T9SS type A sorting domain-containing protein [Bacteroidota bacterium]|nr:T9SS type A sorting domain-containing protein [Bacteroidota bacterium]